MRTTQLVPYVQLKRTCDAELIGIKLEQGHYQIVISEVVLAEATERVPQLWRNSA